MRLRLAILALAASLAGGAVAQDRLAPVQVSGEPHVAGYQLDLRRVFAEAYAPGVRLRAVVLPSFSLEYAVGLRARGTRYEIFFVEPTRQIWTYQILAMMGSGQMRVSGNINNPRADVRDGTAEEIRRLQRSLPRDPRDVPLTRCAIAVDDATAAVLQSAWRQMLEEVRPGELIPGGLDGTSYHSSMELAGRSLDGETWSPREGTRMAKLTRIADAMRAYCTTRGAVHLRELTDLAGQLAAAGPA